MPKRILTGVVVSCKNDKTVTVNVPRVFRHPLYKKTVKKTTKYTAHDENNEYKEGDTVRIQESRPLSRMKRWIVIK